MVGGGIRRRASFIGLSSTPSQDVRRSTPSTTKEQPIRILIVDDQEDSVSFLRCALEERGHVVTLVGTVAAAVAEATARRYELLVADLLLPDGNGWELIRRLRRGAALPAIALSGLGFPADRERSLKAGFSLHLLKPVDIDVLIAAVESLSGVVAARAATGDG